MAEALLFDLTKSVIGQLGSVLFNEVKSVLGVDDELDNINSNLSSIQAVLRDAEKQQSTSESVKNWLQKLQDVVYDIDDLLDEIATEVALQIKNEGDMRRQVRKFFSRSNFAVLRQQWVSQIKDVCKKLDRVAYERMSFVLFSEPTVDSLESSSRETHSNLNEYEILGRDQDRESIIGLILSCGDCERISVLPVVGLGGIGKTTLAKLIYNDKRVDDNFDNKLWVYVSERFNIKKILRQIISVVTGEKLVQLTMENLPLEELRIRVCEALKDKKYFLLLDDMWNEDSNEWRRLKEILDVGAKGSMLVVTTRDLKVASMVKKSVEEYKLSELSDETCLRIFTQLAFKDGEEIEPVLMSLANEIVEKSRGIPFLVTTLGNLLRGRTDERAKFAAGDELAIIDRATKEVSKNTRYISLDEDYLSENHSPGRLLSQAKKTRLLMFNTSEHPLSKSFLKKIISNLKCLRALDLENCQFEKLPRTIGYMKHLRLLCLRNNERIKSLPNSICNLLNLQVLLLNGCNNLKEIPN